MYGIESGNMAGKSEEGSLILILCTQNNMLVGLPLYTILVVVDSSSVAWYKPVVTGAFMVPDTLEWRAVNKG